MHFSPTYITNDGAALVRSALGMSPTGIVWGNAYLCSYSLSGMSESDILNLHTADVSSTSVCVGSVSTVIPQDSGGVKQLAITCELNNTADKSGNANSFVILARLASDADEPSNYKLVFIGKVDTSGGGVVEYIPDANSAPWAASITLTLTLHDSEITPDVTAWDGYYASNTALNNLAAQVNNIAGRVVTTHTYTSATIGEAQEIYGVKTFKNNTVHAGNIEAENSVCTIGTPSMKWGTMYATTFSGDLYGNATSATSLKYSSTNVLTAESSTKVASHSNIVPGTPNIYTLGTSTYPWKNVYVTSSSGYYLEIGNCTSVDDNSNIETTNPVIRPSVNNTGFIGTPKRHFSKAYIDEIYVGSSEESLLSYITDTTVTNATNASKVYTTPLSASANYPLVFTTSVNQSNKSLYTDNENSLYYNPSTNTLTCTTFSGNASTASKVYVSTSSTSANYPLVFTSNVTPGNKSLYTDSVASLYYNPSTDILACPTFKGNLSGNASTATTATNATNVYVNTAEDNTSYPLVFRTSYTGTVTSAGNKSLYCDKDNKITYNPSTNTLTCTTFSGNATSSTYARCLSASTSAQSGGLYASSSTLTYAYASIYPNSDCSFNLGTNSKRWKSIWAKSLHVMDLPASCSSYSSIAYIGIPFIALVRFNYTGSNTVYIKVGETTFDSNSSGSRTRVAAAKSLGGTTDTIINVIYVGAPMSVANTDVSKVLTLDSDTFIKSSAGINAGEYFSSIRFLSVVKLNANAGLGCYALAYINFIEDL